MRWRRGWSGDRSSRGSRLIEDTWLDGGLRLAGASLSGGASHDGAESVTLLVNPDSGREEDSLSDIDDVGDNGDVALGVLVLVVAVGLGGDSGEEHSSDGNKAVLHVYGVVFLSCFDVWVSVVGAVCVAKTGF